MWYQNFLYLCKTINDTHTMNQDIQKLIKRNFKSTYSHEYKMGGITYSNFDSKEQERYCMLLTELIKEHIGDVKPSLVEDTISCFDFNNKVYFKVCPQFVIEHESFRLSFQPQGSKSIELYKIEVYNQGNGLGSQLIEMINAVSKHTGTVVYLRPVDFKNTPLEQLRRWYSRNGFKRCEKSVYWSNNFLVVSK